MTTLRMLRLASAKISAAWLSRGVGVGPGARIGHGVVVGGTHRVSIGANAVIGDHVHLRTGVDGCLVLGAHAELGTGCSISAHHLVDIGAEARLGAGVTVHTATAEAASPVFVGRGAQVGAGAVLLPGAQVPAGAVVEPGAIVGAGAELVTPPLSA